MVPLTLEFILLLLILSSFQFQIYAALDKVMKMSQAEQLKKLQTIHDKQVEDIKRRTEEQHREKRKGLGKTTVDKEELSRCGNYP